MPVEQVLDAQSAGKSVDDIVLPQEFADFQLMRSMNWKWSDLTGDAGEVPWYVQKYCTDFLAAIGRAGTRTKSGHDIAMKQLREASGGQPDLGS